MFTGLIEEIGHILSIYINSSTGQTILIISASIVLQGVALGDSIAVNGVCLTVTSYQNKKEKKTNNNNNSDKNNNNNNTITAPEWFEVGLSKETLSRTNLGSLKIGDGVNLERSLAANGKFGGHFVQCHVDGVATIVDKYMEGDMLVMKFRPIDPSLLMYIVEKGYIAIDGTSLTVTSVDDSLGIFSVMLIQYTMTKVIQAKKNIGDTVNIEVDVLGKYFVKFMQKMQPQLSKKFNNNNNNNNNNTLLVPSKL